MNKEIINIIQRFWQKHPALLYGVAALVGVSFALTHKLIFLLILFVLVSPLFYGRTRQLLLAMAVSLSFFGYTSARYHFIEISREETSIFGQGHVALESIASKSTHFGKRWVYKGVLRSFQSDASDKENIERVNLPCTISLAQSDDILRPPADSDYLIYGRLKELASGYYALVPIKEKPWLPVKGSWSLAEYRFQAKQQVARYIHNVMSDSRSATFLTGVASGDFDDRMMTFEFGRFGLQHIMAISGFHFAIIAGILSVLLSIFMGRRGAIVLLMVLLSLYLLFLGASSSILRAWIAVMIALCGCLLERRGSGLNSLGVALVAILILDPLAAQNLGFQFSFVTTAAILLLFGGCDLLFKQVFPQRSLSQMVRMNGLNQHGYCFLVFFRQAFALTLAVNIIAIPMMLYYFQKFPLLGLVYNLFFPFLVSVSMLLLILGVLFEVIYPLAEGIHVVNNGYTQFVLNFTYNMPTSADVTWHLPSLPLEGILMYLCAVFFAGIVAADWLERRQEAAQDWAFL